MKIIRSDGVKLPGGERRWRSMARLAGFDGTVKVRPFLKSDEHAHRRITMGTMSANGKVITVHINTGKIRFDNSRTYNPLSTFGHELGHFILKSRGRREWATQRVFHSNAEQRADAVERACDRYSRILRNNS